MLKKGDVEHIARLARIELTQSEVEKFEKDLAGILDFVGQLKKVDTVEISPVAGGLAERVPSSLEEETRNDEITETLGDPVGLRNAAPEEKNGWIAVKSVF